MENKEIENAINELIRLKKILLVQCREDVKNIIDNKVTAANYIESTLDKLLDFNDDEDFMELFWQLIGYVETFDDGIGTFYRRLEETMNEGF